MKILKLFIIIILPVAIFLAGCKLEEPSAKKTTTDLKGKTIARYVALGNSLTAGVQSGSLLEDFQNFSFPKQIAEQLGMATFAQPTVAYPGLPNVLELNPLTSSVQYASGGPGVPSNLSYPAPYNNLGIPTATAWDLLHATDSTSNFRNLFFGEHNTAVDLVLRNPNLGGTFSAFQQAKMQHPDLLTLWIGNNDVLGFATSGGLKPITPFDLGGSFVSPATGLTVADFKAAYTELIDSVATLGAMVALANVPDVTSPPFFTTVGPMMAKNFTESNIPYPLAYQKSTDSLTTSPATGQATIDNLAAGDVLVTLVGAGYTDEIGKRSGKWYRDLAAMKHIPVSALLATMPAVDTTQFFGFDPRNPWPGALILDADEIAMARQATAAYNSLISALAEANGFALFDANAFMQQIVDNGGYATQGLAFTATYVSGGIFSLDGIHLSNVGYGIIANQFISALNAKYNMAIAPVNLHNILGHAPVKKVSAAGIKYDLKTMSSLLDMLGGRIW